MTRGSRTVPSHDHVTRDIKPLGQCRACDDYHVRSGHLTTAGIEAAIVDAFPHRALAVLRLLAMLSDINPERHAELVGYLGDGMALAEAVDEAMGEWPTTP